MIALLLAALSTPAADPVDTAVDVAVVSGAVVVGSAAGAVVGVASSFVIFPPFALLPEPLGVQALLVTLCVLGGGVSGGTAALLVWAVDDDVNPLLTGIAAGLGGALGAIGGAIVWTTLVRNSNAIDCSDCDGEFRVMVGLPIVAGTVAALATSIVVTVATE